MESKHAFMVNTTPEVGHSVCSSECIDKINSLNKELEDKTKFYNEQVESLTRRLEDYSYNIYELKKNQKPLKEKCEAAVRDFKKMAEENSINKSYLIFAKEDIAKLTAELEELRSKLKTTESKFENAEFNFKKFDVSSTVVETMIEKQLKFQTQAKDKQGLGYNLNKVPPPYNDNYTPPLETNEPEIPMEYGKKSLVEQKQETESTSTSENESTSQAGSEKVNVTDASASCGGKESVHDEHKQNSVDSETNDLVSDVSQTSMNKDIKPVSAAIPEPIVFVKPGFKSECPCKCNCTKSEQTKTKSQNQTRTKSQNQPRTQSQSFGPGPSPNSFYLKRQTCFNCGIPGHIARNCPNRPYVPYYAQDWQNVSRGSSSNENPSRSRSRDDEWNVNKAINQHYEQDWISVPSGRVFRRHPSCSRSNGDWNVDKAKRQKAKDNRDMTWNSRDGKTKPNSVRSKSSQSSFHSSHLQNKPRVKGTPNSKSSVAAPIRSNHNFIKPNYRWVPKGSMSKLSKTPVNSLHSISDQQDMSWEKVISVDTNGKPSVRMDWVPKSM
jgi:Zinc knuckle